MLSEITEVEPDPQEERAFVVRLSGARLPWTLRARSKVRTLCNTCYHCTHCLSRVACTTDRLLLHVTLL